MTAVRQFKMLAAAVAVIVMAFGVSAQSGGRAPSSDELDMAIRDASDYLNSNIPKGSKIVILNIESVSANLSEYVIDELIANAVNDKAFSVVDRRQLEAIQSEQKFQMSGAVDDKDALAIGKFFGAQTIISGTMRDIGKRYRLTIRALSVQTAQVQGQYNRNMPLSATLNALANSGGGRASGGAQAYGGTSSYGGGAAATPAYSAPAAASSGVAMPLTQGTRVPGNSLAEKLAWLKRTVDSHETYVIEVTADEKIAPHTFEYPGAINVTIAMRGVGGNRTLRLQSNGNMFIINDKITFILENNITLMGHKGNNASLVSVNGGGTLTMNAGVVITGNEGRRGVANEGTFTMNGGIISNNANGDDGGGVYNNGTITMNGGTISGNTTRRSGGGMYNRGTFTMNGGVISGNTANQGGGVFHYSGTFSMKNGTITGNTAKQNGGGLWTDSPFSKTGGTITGYKSDPNNGNIVKDEDGNPVNRTGHAVWVNLQTRKETTSGPSSNMSYGGSKGTTGDWDN